MQELVDPQEGGDEKDGAETKSTLIGTIIGVAIASVIATGAGWFIGGMLAPTALELQEANQADLQAKKNGDEEQEIAVAGSEGPILIRLQPITTNLSFPSESWVRLDISLMLKSEADNEMLGLIHQDMVGYLRTLSLQQLHGARGFQYVRDDLKERAILRSKGNVENILIRTFVIE